MTTPDAERPKKSGNAQDVQIPPPDGATYLTSHRAKTGVGHEPPPIDLREKGDEAKSE